MGSVIGYLFDGPPKNFAKSYEQLFKEIFESIDSRDRRETLFGDGKYYGRFDNAEHFLTKGKGIHDICYIGVKPENWDRYKKGEDKVVNVTIMFESKNGTKKIENKKFKEVVKKITSPYDPSAKEGRTDKITVPQKTLIKNIMQTHCLDTTPKKSPSDKAALKETLEKKYLNSATSGQSLLEYPSLPDANTVRNRSDSGLKLSFDYPNIQKHNVAIKSLQVIGFISVFFCLRLIWKRMFYNTLRNNEGNTITNSSYGHSDKPSDVLQLETKQKNMDENENKNDCEFDSDNHSDSGSESDNALSESDSESDSDAESESESNFKEDRNLVVNSKTCMIPFKKNNLNGNSNHNANTDATAYGSCDVE